MAILGAIVFGKLVYVQLFQNKLYLEKANAQQTRKFDITARRGQIYVNDGNGAIYPIALNQQLFLLAADPKFVKDSADTAGKLSKYLPGDEGAGLESKLNNKDNRYLVIKKSLLSADAEEIKKFFSVEVRVSFNFKNYKYLDKIEEEIRRAIKQTSRPEVTAVMSADGGDPKIRLGLYNFEMNVHSANTIYQEELQSMLSNRIDLSQYRLITTAGPKK